MNTKNKIDETNSKSPLGVTIPRLACQDLGVVFFSGFADEVSVNFEEQLKFLNSINMKYLEIRFVDGENIVNLTDEKLQSVRTMLRDYGIGISAIASPIGKIKVDDPFEPHLDKFKRAVEIASLLDTKLIRVFSYYAPEGKNIDDYRDAVMERMAKKAEVLAGTDFIMVHENESHIFGHDASNCVDIIKTVNSPNLTLAYDPANFVWGDYITNNVDLCWPVMKPYVSHIHIKDWKLGSKDIGSLPGEGDGQIELLIKVLAEMNYSGFITMEPHMNSGGQFGGSTTPEQFKSALANVKAFCDKYKLSYN